MSADATTAGRGIRPRPEVLSVAAAFAVWLCEMLTSEQRRALSDSQHSDLLWAIEQGFSNGYEAAVEDQTGAHRPSLEKEQRGFEAEVRAITSPARVHAGGDDPFDNLRRALGRRNEEIAKMTDENQGVAWLFRDMGVGLLFVCKRRSWDPRTIRTRGVITPENQIVVSVEEGR